MLRQALLTAVIAAAALIPRGAHAEEKLVLKSVTADLPFGDRMFPDGPGSEAVNNNCLAVIPPARCSRSRRYRRSNGTTRSKRCARLTKRRSIPRTSTQSSTISSGLGKRNEQMRLPANGRRPSLHG
jgi:hypothetical protein